MQHWVRICAPCRWSEESQGRNSVAAGEFRGRYRAPGKVQDGRRRNRKARGIGRRQPIGPDFSRKLLGFGMYQSLCCKSILTRISTYVDYLPIIEPVQDYAATVQPAHVNSVSTQQFEKRNCAPIRNPAQTSGPGDHTSSVDRPGLLPDVHVQWDDMLSPTRQDFSSDIIDNNLYMYGTDNANSHTPVTETNTKHYYNGFMGGRSLVGPSVYQGMDSSVPSYDVAIDLRPGCDVIAAGSAPVMSVASWPAGGLTCNVGVPFVTNCTTQSTAYQGMHSAVSGYHVATGRGPITAGSAPFMSATSLPPGGLTNNDGAPIVTNAISNHNSQFTAMSNHLFKRDLLLNVFDVFQVLWVLELVLVNMKSTTCNWLKYLEKYLTPTLTPYHLRRYGNII